MEKDPKDQSIPRGTDTDIGPQTDVAPVLNAPGMTGAVLGVDSVEEPMPAVKDVIHSGEAAEAPTDAPHRPEAPVDDADDAQRPEGSAGADVAAPAPTPTAPTPALATSTAPTAAAPSRHTSEVIDIVYGILAQPQQTFQELARNPRPWWGVISVFIISWVSGFASLRTLIAQVAPGVARSGGGSVSASLGIALAGVIFWLAAVATTHLSAEILGGRGSIMALIGSYGLSYIPQVFLLPIGIVANPGRSGMFWGYGLISLGITIWVIFLHTYAVKHTYKVSGGRAFAAVILPTVAFIVAFAGAIIGLLGIVGPLTRGFPGFPPLR